MPYNKIEICSFALNKLGKSAITTFEGTGALGSTVESEYKLALRSDIANKSWRFATKIQQMSKLVETPNTDTEWSVIYQLPSDYLSMWRVYPQSNYQIYADNKLYSNESTSLTAEYRFEPVPTSLPDYYVDYFQFLLAKRLAMAVAIDIRFTEVMEKQMMQMLISAFAADSQAHPNETILDSPFNDDYGMYGCDTGIL